MKRGRRCSGTDRSWLTGLRRVLTFTGLIQSHVTHPSFPWPNPPSSKLFQVDFPTQNFMKNDFVLSVDDSAINGVTAIFDIGNRIGQAGADFGAALNGTVS